MTHLASVLKAKLTRALKVFGTRRIRTAVWNAEYSSGRWTYLDGCTGDLPAQLVAKYGKAGRILDLGCGTTRNLELPVGSYSSYLGVDLSETAIEQARTLGRPNSEYVVADIVDYMPHGKFDVIFMREVLYYLPPHAAARVLERLPNALNENGVIIVQIWNTTLYARIVSEIQKSAWHLLEEFRTSPDSSTMVLGLSRGGHSS